MKEEWKKIEGYEKYEVSNLGNVRSLDYNRTGETRILKPVYSRGYQRVWLCNEEGEKTFQVHRLVSEAFIPNPNNYPQVNHINEIRDDNRAENLEWCTQQYNMDYSKSKPVLQYSLDGNFIAEYPSAREASRQTGIYNTSIVKCCNGKQYYHSAGGYIWRYK